MNRTPLQDELLDELLVAPDEDLPVDFDEPGDRDLEPAVSNPELDE